jgi:hypothetical protein
MMAAALSLISRRWLRARLAVAVLALSLMLAALGSIRYWHETIFAREAVITARGLTARCAPSEAAQALANLPQGSLVRMAASDAQWAKIAWPAGSGWVPREALEPVRW